jgi:hypothetical protein
MPNSLTKQAKRVIIGRYPDWIKKFDVEDYFNNRPMIEKLYEERQLALTTTLDHEETIKGLANEVDELRAENLRLALKLRGNKKQSVLIFILSLLAAILISIGVNIVTDKPYTWVGWVLIGSSVVLELIIFMIVSEQE